MGLCSFLQPRLNTVRVQNCEDESYIPMVSPSSVTTTESDGYIPMSPRTFSFLSTDNDGGSSSLSPPPIHRHLKPRLRRGEHQVDGCCRMLIHSQTCRDSMANRMESLCIVNFIPLRCSGRYSESDHSLPCVDLQPDLHHSTWEASQQSQNVPLT